MMLSAMIQKQIIAGIFRLLIPALLFGCFFIVFMVRYRLKCRRYTVKLEAKITGYRRSGSRSAAVPQYTYIYDGMIYEQYAEKGKNWCNYRIGQTVTVYVDPENPACFQDRKRDRHILYIVGLLFGIWLFTAVLAVIRRIIYFYLF